MVSEFIISGELRRSEKKKLAELRRFYKTFWFYEDIDRVCGGGLEDSECKKILEKTKIQIETLEYLLSRKVES